MYFTQLLKINWVHKIFTWNMLLCTLKHLCVLQAASEAEDSISDEQSGEVTIDDASSETSPDKAEETSQKIVTDIINNVIDEVVPAENTERQPAEGCESEYYLSFFLNQYK